jgi:outer membrane protein OmpA-like peptidoglycan-associated protein
MPGTGSEAGVSGPDSHIGFDDLRLHLKLDILHGLFKVKNQRVGLALVPVVTFPIAKAISEDSFMGDSSFTFHPKLSFGVKFDRVRLGLNMGYLLRENKDFLLSKVGSRLSYGAAVEFDIITRLTGIVELFGQSGFDGSITQVPLEADAAVRYRLPSGIELTAGAGAGIFAGIGTPAFRLFGGLAFSPPTVSAKDSDGDGLLDEEDNCPTEPEDNDNFEDDDGCPDPDNDRDGIPDERDKCPDAPEDKDGFEDDDGCPDPDNDGDGMPDGQDKCPDDPEDSDGFEDEDGCPEPDNDGDGILDLQDRCPLQKEDVDKFNDQDGCPDLDNDADGLPDERDKCPNEKEILNGVEDEDGCPDKGRELVIVKDDRFEMLEKVNFATNSDKIVGKKSFKVLDSVVTIMLANPNMALKIEGHTDSRGNRKHNLDLSLRRAKAVMMYLIEKGVNPENLEAIGHGPDKPVESNKTKAGRAQNRRVEYNIIRR